MAVKHRGSTAQEKTMIRHTAVYLESAEHHFRVPCILLLNVLFTPPCASKGCEAVHPRKTRDGE